MPDETHVSELVRQMRLADPVGTVYLAIYRSAARFSVPEGASHIYSFLHDFGRFFVIAETPYEDLGLPSKVPRELRYFVLTLAPDRVMGAQIAYREVDLIHTACQLSANSGAAVVRETLFTEFPFGQFDRFFRMMPFDTLPSLPRNGRFVDKEATAELARALLESPDRDRIMIAASHYREALGLWKPGAAPLVLLHLFIAVEALSVAFLRKELATRQISEDDLMQHYGITPGERSSKTRLLGCIKTDLIFQGDDSTYQTAKDCSDGIEHGYLNFQAIWSVPFDVHERLGRYVREAIIALVDVRDPHRGILLGNRFQSVCRESEPPIKQGVFRLGEPADFRTISYRPSVVSVKVDTDGAYSFRFSEQVN